MAAEVAKPFGGGGHARAAGCTLETPLEEALGAVLDRAKSALDARN